MIKLAYYSNQLAHFQHVGKYLTASFTRITRMI